MNQQIAVWARRATLTVLFTSSPLVAQDRGERTLVIQAGERSVGSETYSITPRAGGLRIVTRASYTTVRPGLELAASVDRGSGAELAFQLERRTGKNSSQVYAVQKRNRLTVRRVDRGAEEASELPGADNVVLLADSVFSLFFQIANLATDSGRPLTAIFPQTGRRVELFAQLVPSPAGTLVRFTGGLEGEIQLGNQGEVLRISLPSLGLDAVAKPE